MIFLFKITVVWVDAEERYKMYKLSFLITVIIEHGWQINLASGGERELLN
jgi:hypothetical protein